MNLTQEWKVVSEERKGTSPKPGHDLVVYELVDHGLQFRQVLRDGERLEIKKRRFGRSPEYASYAVNMNPNLPLSFTDRFDHMSVAHSFDLTFSVQIHVNDAEELVKKLSDDPIKMLRDEITQVVGGEISKIPWEQIEHSKKQNNFTTLSDHVLQGSTKERLLLFATHLGIELKKIDLMLRFTSLDEALLIEEVKMKQESKLAEMKHDSKREGLRLEQELAVIEKENENEIIKVTAR